jgi:hypothetical protein
VLPAAVRLLLCCLLLCCLLLCCLLLCCLLLCCLLRVQICLLDSAPQSQVHNRPEQQVMLEGKVGGLITIFTFGQQSAKQQQPAATPLNLLEGSAIFCVPA